MVTIPGLSFHSGDQTDNLLDIGGNFKIWKSHRNGNCRTTSEFLRTFSNEQNDGTFYRCYDKKTGDVLLKKCNFDINDDAQLTAFMCEVNTIHGLQSDNLTKLHHIVCDETSDHLFMSFEYLKFSLADLLNYSTLLTPPMIKNIMKQLFTGLAYLHSAGHCHGNLSTSSILFDLNGKLKFADFSSQNVNHEITEDDVTKDIHWSNHGAEKETENLRFKCLEYLLGSTAQHPTMDLWSVGIIFSELLVKKAMYRCNTIKDCITQMFIVLGQPSEEQMPKITEFLERRGLRVTCSGNESHIVNGYSGNGGEKSSTINLLGSLLVYDPTKRLPAKKCLKHKYFKERPEPSSEADLAKVLDALSIASK